MYHFCSKGGGESRERGAVEYYITSVNSQTCTYTQKHTVSVERLERERYTHTQSFIQPLIWWCHYYCVCRKKVSIKDCSIALICPVRYKSIWSHVPLSLTLALLAHQQQRHSLPLFLLPTPAWSHSTWMPTWTANEGIIVKMAAVKLVELYKHSMCITKSTKIFQSFAL